MVLDFRKLPLLLVVLGHSVAYAASAKESKEPAMAAAVTRSQAPSVQRSC